MDWQSISEKSLRQRVADGLLLDQADLDRLSQDSRAGVRRLAAAQLKSIREKARVDGLYRFEKELYQLSVGPIAGVDEVGRGPLAGPVVAAAVILPPSCFIAGLNDSKKVAAPRRTQIAAEIRAKAVAWAIGAVGSRDIDRLNIRQASFLAMKRAVRKLSVQPEFLLVDGMIIEDAPWAQRGIVRGDALSASIAAASIIAKCHRDQLMEIYDQRYPEYGFAQHKGYPTAEHGECLRRLGRTPIHRCTFHCPEGPQD